MDEAPRNEMLLHLANASLEGAAVRVLEVALVGSDATIRAGYPTRVSLGAEPRLVVTAHGAAAGGDQDVEVDLDDAMWAWASASDGSTLMFGENAAELHALLSTSLEESKTVDKRGAAVGLLGVALGLLSHAMGDLSAADRSYRGAMTNIVMQQPPRIAGDVWMRLADVYADLKDWEAWKGAIGQAISAYDLGLGVHHPITVRAKQALAGRA